MKSYVQTNNNNNHNQRIFHSPNGDGILNEIQDEDLNNSNDEDVKRKR